MHEIAMSHSKTKLFKAFLKLNFREKIVLESRRFLLRLIHYELLSKNKKFNVFLFETLEINSIFKMN